MRLSRKLPSREDAQSPHPYRLAKAHMFTTHLSQPNFPTHWLCDLFTGRCLPLGPQFPIVAHGDRDTDEISETAVTSIYCTFAPGRGCACVWCLIPLTPQGRVCFLPCSLNAETEAQRSDLVSPWLRSHQIMESGLETRAPFLEPNCYFKKLLDDFVRWGP